MFGTSKSMIMATFLTGVTLAAGIIIYGELSPEKQDLPLSSYLPPVSEDIILPPPANIFVTTAPQETVPGIRRLKLVKPNPNKTDLGEQSEEDAKDYYLTGTRSAELIREPVDAQIETFPTTNLEDAVKGALSVDEWGFQAVQNYLNQALGDEDQLKLRMDALLTRLGEMAPDYDLATVADAANLIIEAGSRTYWTAFMVPVVLDPNFQLTDNGQGWDFGPAGYEPYPEFTRVSPANKIVIGRRMQHVNTGEDQSILRQGIRDIQTFGVNGLDNGRYRVIVLSSRMSSNVDPLYPFGVNIKRNGATINLVDTRATDELVPVMVLATNGPGRLSETPNLIDASLSGEPPATGHMLITRADVIDGSLTINFNQLGRQDTYITSIIIYNEPESSIEDELALQIAEFLQNIAPAAGGNLTREQILANLPIVDPILVFADGGNGLPTPGSNSPIPPGQSPDDTGGPGTGFPPPGGGGGGTPPGGGGGGTPPGGGGGGTPPGGGGGGTPPGGGGGGTPPGGGGGGTPPGGGGGGTPPGGGGGGTPPSNTASVVAEAGVYDPIDLGEDFTLDACGSTFSSAIICSITSLEAFELTWLLGDTILGTGQTLLLNSGEGTLFSTTGDYNVTLQIRYDGTLLGDGEFVNLITGGTIFLPGDIILTSLDTAIISIVAASVPEPATGLVLIPGLLFMARRHRRKKTKSPSMTQN